MKKNNKTHYCYNCQKEVNGTLKKQQQHYKFKEKNFKIKEEIRVCNCGYELYDEVVINKTLKTITNLYEDQISIGKIAFKPKPLNDTVLSIIHERLNLLIDKEIPILELHTSLVPPDEYPIDEILSFYGDKDKAIQDLQLWLPDLVKKIIPQIQDTWAINMFDMIEEPEQFHLIVIQHQVGHNLMKLPLIRQHHEDTIVLTADVIKTLQQQIKEHIHTKTKIQREV